MIENVSQSQHQTILSHGFLFILVLIFFVSIRKTESPCIHFDPTLFKGGFVLAPSYITMARDNRFLALCIEEYFGKPAVYNCKTPSHAFDYIRKT